MSNPAGINCGEQCQFAFAKNSYVTLTAAASNGFLFKGWGGACGGANLTCQVSMTEARNVTVNFESTEGKPDSIDAVISSMPANSWKSLPSTQMKDVCPLPYNDYACEAVVMAWSGGAYDDKRDRLFVYGGGHADSWYNNIFAFDLAQMKWHRLTEMSPGSTGAAPAPEWKDIRVESCGYYPKGPLNLPPEVMKGSYVAPEKCFVEPVVSQLDFQQPRSAHTYNGVFYDRIRDQYCSLAGNGYPSGQAQTSVVNCYNPNTGLWSRIKDRPPSTANSQSALDSSGQVWSMTQFQGYIGNYNPSSDTWTNYGLNNSEGPGSADIDRKHNHFYTLQPRTDGTRLLKWDLNDPAQMKLSKGYTVVTATGEIPENLGNQPPGFVFADSLNLFYAWYGGRDLYIFNPDTNAWKKVSATGDDPGSQQRWGTFGRFRYSANKKVFVLVNGTKQNVFIYKP